MEREKEGEGGIESVDKEDIYLLVLELRKREKKNRKKKKMMKKTKR